MISSLSIRGLRVETGTHGRSVELLKGVDVDVLPGQVTALVGSSGSGKSLTCTAMQGLLPSGLRVAGGAVLVDGVQTEPDALRGRTIATIMQNPRSAFNPVLTMRAHVQEGLSLRRIEASSHEKLAINAMGRVGLDDALAVLDLYPFQMSGGMLQRMMIALAILSEAPFLIADEPTTDLDLVVQAQVLNLLAELVREQGLGVLLVTHDVGVVARLANQVCIMQAGEIVERQAVAEFFSRPQHEASRMLIAAHRALYEEMAQ